VADEVLTRRQLNRALLTRQMLLARVPMPVRDAVEHLVAMQAQVPMAPYVGLWSRLDPFDPDELSRLITERQAVRMGLLRTTLHLVTEHDALWLWPITRPVLERAWKGSAFSKQVAGVDRAALLSAARRLLDEKPRTLGELRRRLGQRWPAADATALSYAARYLLPIVQVPPRGTWGGAGAATWTTLEAWLQRPPEVEPSLELLVHRYLAAFGPASVNDIQAWSWLTRLRPVVDGMRPSLRTFRDDQGRELFDLPEAPRPDPDTPAPPRFLPDFDNLILSHADRFRVISEEDRARVLARAASARALLVDGFVCGSWRTAAEGPTTILTVELFGALAASDRDAVSEEGMRLLAFVAPAAGHAVRFVGQG
jgi:hypothetical protein